MQLSKEKIEMDKWDLEWRRSTGWMCLLKWENAGRNCWSPVEDPPLWKTTQGCIEIKPSWEMGPKSIWRRLVVELKKMVFAERKAKMVGHRTSYCTWSESSSSAELRVTQSPDWVRAEELLVSWSQWWDPYTDLEHKAPSQIKVPSIEANLLVRPRVHCTGFAGVT